METSTPAALREGAGPATQPAATPGQPASLVEVPPSQPAPLVEVSPGQPAPLVEVPPSQPAPLVEVPPSQPAPLVEGPLDQPAPLMVGDDGGGCGGDQVMTLQIRGMAGFPTWRGYPAYPTYVMCERRNWRMGGNWP